MVIAIVGCGSSGSAIGSQLSNELDDGHIRFLDVDKGNLKKLTDDLSQQNKKIQFEYFQVNASVTEDLVKYLDDVTVVVNAASPVFNIPIMKACIKTKTNYIDLGSDPFKYEGINEETSIDAQLQLHDLFVKNDLVAITNAGASPGFSDLLCRHAAETISLDSIDMVKIYFSEIIRSDVFISSWSPYILLLESLLPGTVLSQGKIHILNSSKRKKNIRFPRPFGSTDIIIFNGHPELRTIPQFMNVPVSYIEIGGNIALNDMNIDGIILEAVRRKVNNTIICEGDIFQQLAESFESTNSFTDFYKNGMIKQEELCCMTEITGKTKDHRIQYNASTAIDISKIIGKTPQATATSYMVSVVPTILIKKIIQNEIIERGVIAPAALQTASEIINISKNFDINFKEETKIL
jgi:saccharopine dehydrogenase-like NADP-dependent oxidoreductase